MTTSQPPLGTATPIVKACEQFSFPFGFTSTRGSDQGFLLIWGRPRTVPIWTLHLGAKGQILRGFFHNQEIKPEKVETMVMNYLQNVPSAEARNFVYYANNPNFLTPGPTFDDSWSQHWGVPE